MEKKMPTSATNELGKHPSKMVTTELLEKTNNETNKLVVGLWKTSQNWGEILPLQKKNIIDNTNEMENFFHQDDR